MEKKKSRILVHILTFIAGLIVSLILLSGFILTHGEEVTEGEIDKSTLSYYETTGTLSKLEGSYENDRVHLSWDSIDGAGIYEIYRKVGAEGKYRKIATVNGNSYSDVFRKIKSKDCRKLWQYGRHIDVTENPLCYKVIAKDSRKAVEVMNYQAPVVIDACKNDLSGTVKWSAVKNADFYEVYSASSDGVFKKRLTVRDADQRTEDVYILRRTCLEKDDRYICVRAGFKVNGITEYSDFSSVFDAEGDVYEDVNILYLGDSLTYGSPYKLKKNRNLFSYPDRVGNASGATYLNASVPGETYAKYPGYLAGFVEPICDRLREGEEFDLGKYRDEKILNDNVLHQSFEDFDVVVMAGGANDYGASIRFGTTDDRSLRTMNGSINTIMDYISEANTKRISEGRTPVKIIFFDLLYGEKYKGKKTNRFRQKNNRGLTLSDYQDDIERLVEKYREEGLLVYRFGNYDIVNELTCSTALVDDLHMSKETDAEIADSLVSFMKDINIFSEDRMSTVLKYGGFDPDTFSFGIKDVKEREFTYE